MCPSAHLSCPTPRPHLLSHYNPTLGPAVYGLPICSLSVQYPASTLIVAEFYVPRPHLECLVTGANVYICNGKEQHEFTEMIYYHQKCAHDVDVKIYLILR